MSGWVERFIAGGPEQAGPIAADFEGYESEYYVRRMLESDACFTAREEGRIGPLAYLPGITLESQAEVDWLCGTFYRVEAANWPFAAGEDPDAAVAGYPSEWATLDGPEYLTVGHLIQGAERARVRGPPAPDRRRTSPSASPPPSRALTQPPAA